MCSNKTKAKWDDIMESGEKKTHLISTIYYLHSSIIELQDAVANNDYSAQSYAEEEISKLIPEVII